MSNRDILASSTYTILDLTDGIDSYTIVISPESHIIQCDELGVPKENEIGSASCRVKSKVTVKKGAISLTPIGESNNLTVNQYKYRIRNDLSGNCVGARLDNERFYINEISGESGSLVIEVSVENNNNSFFKEITWVKSLDSEKPRDVRIIGLSQFHYDNSEDTTPTPSFIELEVKLTNIADYSLKWKYNNNNSNEWKDVVNQVGSEIIGNKLKLNDSALFLESKELFLKVIVVDRIHNKEYVDIHSVVKLYDGDGGDPGEPGDPSKTVRITGPDKIKYTDGVAEPSSITLTAIPSNYITPKYRWYRYISGNFELMDLQDENTIIFSHVDLDNTNLFKVECSEINNSHLSFDEFQVIKIYDGDSGDVYDITITDGTRNICYNGNNNLLTTEISPFEIEVYKNNSNVTGNPIVRSITWGTKGHYTNPTNIGGNTFTPIPIDTYDETKLDTQISVVVNCEGRILKASVPITVSKNSTALDWVEEWDGSKVDIGGTSIISPKIFAGKKDLQTNEITGIALGQDVIAKNDAIGMAIYYKNKLLGRINADPTVDNNNLISFGDPDQGRMVIKTDGSMTIESGVIVDEMEDVYQGITDAEKNAIASSNANTSSQLEGYVTNETHGSFSESVNGQFNNVNQTISDTAESIKGEILPSIDEVQKEQAEYKKYIQFVDGTIVLGQVNSTLKIVIRNDRIQFVQSGHEVAYIDHNKLYIKDAEILERIKIGRFAYEPRSNGNLSFVWKG